jgi:arabinofuranosyltransferase
VLAFLPWLALAVAQVLDSWFLCDDAFICFRYARNLIEGHGLVFNRGERVEGYTQLAWVLEIAALWGWLGIRPEHGSLLLSVAFTLGTGFLTLRLAHATPLPQLRRVATWLAAGLLAINASFGAWTTSGMETRQFTFLVLAGLVLFTNGRMAWGSLALGLATLTRPEGALVAIVCIAWHLSRSFARGSLTMRTLLAAAGPVLVLAGAQLVLRLLYYDDWLPNTWHAKHVRPWYEAGSRYLLSATVDTGLYLQVPLAMLAAWVLRNSVRGRLHLLSLLCVLPHAAYCAHIGGDFFEYRFLDFYWPLLAIACADAIVWLARGRRAVAVALGAVIIAYCACLQISMVWLSRDLDTRAETAYLHVELSASTAPWLRWLPGGLELAAISNRARFHNVRHLVGQRVREHVVFGRQRQRDWSPYERLERGLLPRDAVAATNAVGAMPFYLADLTVIDQLGLCDRVIARAPVVTPNSERILAHDRRPPLGYLEQRGVNIDVKPPAASCAAALGAAPFALRFAEQLWMPFDSPDPAWVERAFGHLDLARRAPLTLAGCSNGVSVVQRTATLVWSSPADAGLDYRAASSFGQGPIKLLGREVPLSDDLLLQITLGEQMPGWFRGYAGRLDALGTATVQIEVPEIEWLRGRTMHTVFLSLRDGAIVSVSSPMWFEIR